MDLTIFSTFYYSITASPVENEEISNDFLNVFYAIRKTYLSILTTVYPKIQIEKLFVGYYFYKNPACVVSISSNGINPFINHFYTLDKYRRKEKGYEMLKYLLNYSKKHNFKQLNLTSNGVYSL
jgi:hypothetical protein